MHLDEGVRLAGQVSLGQVLASYDVDEEQALDLHVLDLVYDILLLLLDLLA